MGPEGEKSDIKITVMYSLNNKRDRGVAKCATFDRSGPWHKGGRGESNFVRNTFVTRRHTVRIHHVLELDALGCIRGKIDCLDSRDSGEGFGGVGRMRDGPR